MNGASWFVGAEERLRPFTVTQGRTKPAQRLGVSCLVLTTPAGREANVLSPEANSILSICREGPRSVAEVAARLRQIVTVVEILLGDLLNAGLVRVQEAVDQRPDADMLRRVLRGLYAA